MKYFDIIIREKYIDESGEVLEDGENEFIAMQTVGCKCCTEELELTKDVLEDAIRDVLQQYSRLFKLRALMESGASLKEMVDTLRKLKIIELVEPPEVRGT